MFGIENGLYRWKRFQIAHRNTFGAEFAGEMLEFGCGAGHFMIAGEQNGCRMFGVEVDENRQEQYAETAAAHAPAMRDRFTLYEGRLLPFESNRFDGVYSWFVFEHVVDSQTCLREIVRTLKPGGTLTIFADDTRNAWDGHASIAWPPYLPREFASAYLDGLGLGDQGPFITKFVVYISAPQIADILTTLGMKVDYAGPPAPAEAPFTEGLYVTNETEARALGRKIAAMPPKPSPMENLTLMARKLP